jgi:hypothetical protein
MREEKINLCKKIPKNAVLIGYQYSPVIEIWGKNGRYYYRENPKFKKIVR